MELVATRYDFTSTGSDTGTRLEAVEEGARLTLPVVYISDYGDEVECSHEFRAPRADVAEWMRLVADYISLH